MSYVGKGASLLKVAIDKVGPSLPPPGPTAAVLVSEVLGLVEGAIANHENLAALQKRAVALLDILQLSPDHMRALPQFRPVIGDFVDLLREIKAYVSAYGERNCVIKLLTSSRDRGEYEDLVARLSQLHERAMLGLQVDGNVRLQELQASVAEVLAAVQEASAVLREKAEYKDPSAAARKLVEEYGGMEAVLQDTEKMRRVKQELDIGAQMTIDVMMQLLSAQQDKAPHRNISHPDLRAFWKKQYGSQTEVPWFCFWKDFPSLLLDIVDETTVGSLRRLLAAEPSRLAVQRAVERLNPDTVSVFELRVAFSGEESLIEQVARMAQRLLAGSVGDAAANAAAVVAPATAGTPVLPVSGPGSARASGGEQHTDGAGLVSLAAGPGLTSVRCQLPCREPALFGRDDEAASLAAQLLSVGSLALVAPGGMGKSWLAVEVGWRLLEAGQLPGGALRVDLRGAGGGGAGSELAARFCAALGIQPVVVNRAAQQTDAGQLSRNLLPVPLASVNIKPNPQIVSDKTFALILTTIQNMAGSSASGGASATALAPPQHPALQPARPAAPPCALLLLVDNAEDALLHPDAAELLGRLVSSVTREAPAVRLLLTSRATLRTLPGLAPGCMTEHAVGAISEDAAAALVRSKAAELTEQQAAAVVAACGCVPLVLQLVSDALAYGRMALEVLPKLAHLSGRGIEDSSSATPMGGTATACVVNAATSADISTSAAASVGLVLRCLALAQQLAVARLAVFPSAFDEEAAAAVLAMTPRQAQSLLAVLYGHSLLQRTESRQYVMHNAVREAAMQLGCEAVGPALRTEAEARYVRYMCAALTAWAAMYGTAGEWRLALEMARAQQADLGRLAELLAGDTAAGAGARAGADATGMVAPPTHGSVVTTTPVAAAAAASATADALAVLREAGLALTDEVVDLLGALEMLARFEPACACVLVQPDWGEADALLRGRVLHVRGRSRLFADACEDAEADLHCALSFLSKALGEEHPDTLATLHTLGVSMCMHDRFEEAEVLLRRVYTAYCKVHGTEHRRSADALSNLAYCLDMQEKYVEAEQHHRAVLGTRERLLGTDHPDTAVSVNNLAYCLENQERHADAEPLYRRAVKLWRDSLGDEHPQTASAVNNLAACLEAQGRHAEAEPLYRQALAARQQLFGTRHRDVAQSASSLAECLSELGRHAEAEPYYRQAVDACRQLFHEEDEYTVDAVQALAACMGKLKAPTARGGQGCWCSDV